MKRWLSMVVLLAAAGCRDGSYGAAQVTAQQGDMSATLDFVSGVVLDEGSATSAHIELHARDTDVLPGDMQSADATILRVAHTPGDANRFVFLGVKAGATKIHILARGQVVATVPVTVRPLAPYAPPDAGIPWVTPADAGPGDAGVALDAASDAPAE